jgi:hypothetical protein
MINPTVFFVHDFAPFYRFKMAYWSIVGNRVISGRHGHTVRLHYSNVCFYLFCMAWDHACVINYTNSKHTPNRENKLHPKPPRQCSTLPNSAHAPRCKLWLALHRYLFYLWFLWPIMGQERPINPILNLLYMSQLQWYSSLA